MGAKVWYVAAGKKKAGPMTSGRLRRQVGAGKLPASAVAWREGMESWQPIDEIEHLQAQPEEAEEAPVQPAPRAPRAPQKKKASRKKQKSGTRRAAPADAASSLSFVPLHRTGWFDLWRAFSLGMAPGRLKLALAAALMPAVGGGAAALLGLLAAKLHVLLAVPFFLGAGLLSYVLTAAAAGALSYYSRHQLQEQEPPSVGEALQFALQRAGAMGLPPFLLSLSWLVPALALGVLALLVKVPYVGPIGTGLTFGVHLTLGAAILFLLVAAGVAGLFGPVVAAFEETGAKATMGLVLDFARRSLARTFVWGALPSMAMGPFAGILLVLGLLTLALPLGALFASCGPATLAWLQAGATGASPYEGAMTMLILLVAWAGLLSVSLGSVLLSVNNALISLLYLAGRAGNDALISRDSYLSRRAEGGN